MKNWGYLCVYSVELDERNINVYCVIQLRVTYVRMRSVKTTRITTKKAKRSVFAKTVKVAAHYQNVLPTLHVKCKRRCFLCLVEVTKDPSCPLI